MVRRTGQQGVPVIAIDNEYIVGFDRPRLEQALARGAHRLRFGAAIADAGHAAAKRPGTPLSGAYVGRVVPGSAAEHAGLMAGDVIVALNGQPVASAADLEMALARLQPGASVAVTSLRGAERRELRAVV